MADSVDTRAYGWEMHSDEGNSDKFYRIIVFLSPDPGVIYFYGGRGSLGVVDVKPTATAEAAIAEAVGKTRTKQRKYELSRDFTVFSVPADYASPSSRKENAHRIALLFGQQSDMDGTSLPNAVPVA
ncbi:hypothetical protein [Streptomyces yaizuensis]|uniref:WGR domain-containing protein n=1 Tax=Streptomyces yaizuensis TaxID=2989713 RepID=A0ABQ5P618_9ACTN|nr:hypothetical protein [Streptomyces sp. YSPA8]GLF98041.1 WGR domain-containing protein [Streptomyces sp. YSPA8]